MHPDQPYEVNQCQPLESRRVTRAQAKRKSTDDHLRCTTTAKRARRNSFTHQPDDSQPGTSSEDHLNELAASCCGQVRSAIMAGALGGPAIHTILSGSLISMLAVLRMTLVQTFSPSNRMQTPQATTQTVAHNAITNGVSPARLIAAMPHLMALARIHLPPAGAGNPAGNPRAPPNNVIAQIANHQPQQMPPGQRVAGTQTTGPMGRQILHSGGVGITASANDSCIFYYCKIRLRIRIDMGSSRETLVSTPF